MSSSTNDPGGRLKTALDNYEAVLTPEQKKSLLGIAAVPDATAVIAFTTELDNKNAERGSCCVATRLLPFLQSIQQFTTVVDTFVSYNPTVPALVWGSVKLAVLLTSNNASYFDKLSTLLMSFGKHCPRYSEYQILYSDSVDLQVTVRNFYAVVIDCCTQVVQVISKSEQPRAFWRPFKIDELGRFEKEFRECKSEVDAEIHRALHQTLFREQQLQLIDRKAAARNRDTGSIFRARVDKSNEEEKRWRIQVDERQARSRKQELLDRLSNYDHITPLRRASLKRHGSTAGWLTKSTEFADWMSDPKSNIFTLSGKLGSGKTVITACTVSHLFAKFGKDCQIVYFFCQFDNAESLSASLILRALVRQFLDTKTLPESIETSLVNVLKVPFPETRGLGILLKDVLVITKCSYIFIDAIDECAKTEWKTLLGVLQDIMVSCSSKVKVFLAVRQGIVEEMRKICKSDYHATMGSSEVDSNIKTYIEDVLAERKNSGQLVVGNPELINEITDALVRKADGMFLWVAFQIEDICGQVCDRDIRETIRKLPKNLPETYNRILSRIAKTGNARLAKKVFPWVATARRPLLLEELREAIAVEPLQSYSDPERLVNELSQIVSCCENLILLDEQDDTVQFTHQTVKMFLLDSCRDESNADFHFEQRETNHYAGEICVTYLNFNDFQRKLIRKPKELPLPTPEAILTASLSDGPSSIKKSIWRNVARLKGLRREYNLDPSHVFIGADMYNDSRAMRELKTENPFVSYAAEYWLHHCADFERNKTQTWRLWKELLVSKDGPATMPWEYSELSKRTRTICRWICDHEHVALLSVIESSENPFAEVEIQCLFDFAIERPSLRLFDSVLRECHNLTRVLNESLIVAVGGGHQWATDRLIAENADPNWRASGSVDKQHDSQGPELSMTIADINAQSKKYEGLTALQAAAKGGYLQLVDQLITAKADVNAKAANNSGRTALQAAAEAGHLEVVERLLTAKADVNAGAAEKAGRTALQAAAEKGHLEVVERLLRAKADVNAGAAKNGHLEVAERDLLVKVDVNARAARASRQTALQAAARNGHLKVVDRLLTAKADVNAGATEDFGRTALQAAAENGHLEVVERLLIARADVNANGKFVYQTALQAGAGNGHLEVVDRLLAAKADVNAGAGYHSRRKALQAAAGNGHLEVVERLLTAKADVNAEAAGFKGRTALQAAAETGHLKVVERLLTAKADVNAEAAESCGRTALQAAAESGHLKVVERLLIAKADVYARAAKYSGRTALQAAAGTGHLEVVERLLTAKADVNAGAGYGSGRTALQAAAGNGHMQVFERLLIAKADIHAAAGYDSGRTALQAAAENGQLKVVKRLLTAKADVYAKAATINGLRALQAAAENGHLEVVDRLLLAATDIYAGRRSDRLIALRAAATKGHLEVVERFITAKVDVNQYSDQTALQAAAGAGHLEVVESLIAAKAKVNASAAGYPYRTALQAAAGNGHLEVVDRLLNAKAAVDAGAAEFDGCTDSRTALQAAAETGHLEVVERLLTAKANVNARAAEFSDLTALQAAAENGHLEVVQRLLKANIAREDVLARLKAARIKRDDQLIKLLDSAVNKR